MNEVNYHIPRSGQVTYIGCELRCDCETQKSQSCVRHEYTRQQVHVAFCIVIRAI